jgi:peptidoglycan L-alanyl-D-glutamate endopeptidase CwlK
MIEQVSLDRINTLHPKIREEVKGLYVKAFNKLPAGFSLRITEAYRSFAYQSELYAKGRTKEGKVVTKAQAGQSYHNYGLAFDFCLIKDSKPYWTVDENWQLVVDVFVAAGYTWGGKFKSIKDYPHFEKTFGYDWRGLLALYNKKKFIAGTEYLDI